jgi:asparagine synthase (glutamine-hydrolysing)
MCGIAGVFGGGDRDTVGAMLEALIHRGPDDGHVVAGREFALGARRLSIMDVSEGRQPMSNETGAIWAAQNGELYNFPEIYPALLGRGHRLQTRCDTEVLPHLYEDYGVALPERIDGMFAVALWDVRTRTGLLARDRMGKKPLYYWEHQGALWFASEIKSLLRVPGFRRRLNLEALHHYLGYKHVPHPHTIFDGVCMLPPAHRLIYRPGVPLRVERYWELPLDVDPALDALPEEELVEQLLDLLRRGVERRLMSDVPIGFFLSGGLDSSLSTALAAEMCPGRIKTFTLTYGPGSTTPGKEEDRRWARWVAEKYDTEHLEETIAFQDFPGNFRRILAAFDEPFSGVVSTYFLSRLIGKHVKVALAGDGADELFGSYLSHRLANPLAHFAEYQRTGDAALIRPFEDRPEFLGRLAETDDWAWRAKLLVFSDAEKRELYSPDIAAALRDCSTAHNLRAAFAPLRDVDPLNRVLKAEFRTFLPDQVLAFVDRLSMAHALEIRSAFLDTDLVTFVSRLSGRWKIRDGQTKYLLKRAALRYFPEEMVCRPKEGFVMPVNAWLMRDLEDYVRQTLDVHELNKHGLFCAVRVQRWLDEFYAGRTEHANKVLSLLAFQEWHALYRPEVVAAATAQAA